LLLDECSKRFFKHGFEMFIGEYGPIEFQLISHDQ
jgi:hypothetical protein